MFEPDNSTGLSGYDHRNSAMRWRTTIALGMLGAAVAIPDLAQAQFSPQGLIGGIARPFRQMLRRPPRESALAGLDRRPGRTPTKTFSALHSGRTTMRRGCVAADLM